MVTLLVLHPPVNVPMLVGVEVAHHFHWSTLLPVSPHPVGVYPSDPRLHPSVNVRSDSVVAPCEQEVVLNAGRLWVQFQPATWVRDFAYRDATRRRTRKISYLVRNKSLNYS
jgi:hypothetical protein